MIINFLCDKFCKDGTPNHNIIPISFDNTRNESMPAAGTGFINYKSITETVSYNNDVISPHEIKFIRTKNADVNEKNIYLIQLHADESGHPWPLLYIPRIVVKGVNLGYITVVIASFYSSPMVPDRELFHNIIQRSLKSAGITNWNNIVFLFSDFTWPNEFQNWLYTQDLYRNRARIHDVLDTSFHTRPYMGCYRTINYNMWEKCTILGLKFYNPTNIDLVNEYLAVKEKPYTFLMLNNNPKPHRFLMYKCLEQDNLLKDAMYSYRFNDSWNIHNNPYDLSEFRNLLTSDNLEISNFKSYLDNNKLIHYHELVNDQVFGPAENGYWDLTKNSTYLNFEHTKNTYFSLLIESSPFKGQSQLTEKTYKLLYYGHPFIMWGPPNALAELHNLGYKTFPFLFDESYDSMEPSLEKMFFIKNQIKQYCGDNGRIKFSEKFSEIEEVLNHNRNLYLTKDHLEFWANL